MKEWYLHVVFHFQAYVEGSLPVGQLRCSVQRYSQRCWKWISEPSGSLIAWLSWISSGIQSINSATIADSARVVLAHHLSQSFLRLLNRWRLGTLRIRRGGANLWEFNEESEVEDIHRFWGSYELEWGMITLWLPWLAPSVLSDPGSFVFATIVLKTPTVSDFGDYGLQPAVQDRKLRANKNKTEPKHNPGL